jgi:GntR family transcriptional repressor for pyruvate dehydrogenase complex
MRELRKPGNVRIRRFFDTQILNKGDLQMIGTLAASLASELEEQIRKGKYRQGERLPSERILAEKRGVSRGVVREALKILSERGFVRSQTGMGTIIVCAEPSEIVKKIESAIYGTAVELEQILEIRKMLETTVVNNIIDNITPNAISSIRNAYTEIDRVREIGGDVFEADSRFHLALAEHCGNTLLSVLCAAFFNTSGKRFYELLKNADGFSIDDVQHEHMNIIRAIEAADRIAAADAVKSHIECIHMMNNDIIKSYSRAKPIMYA